APFFLAQAAAPHLVASQGAIVNLVDVYAERPLREHTVYCMAKAALLMMTRSLALELGPEVRVNAVSPGAILWPEENGDAEDRARPHGHPRRGRRGGALAGAGRGLQHRPGVAPGRRADARRLSGSRRGSDPDDLQPGIALGVRIPQRRQRAAVARHDHVRRDV